MWDIITSNYLLWFNLLIPIGIAVYFVVARQEYSLKEFLAQVALTTIILFGLFFIGYSTQDISTVSYENGKVQKFVYEEEWTELVHYTESYKCGKSTCYRSKTRYDHHPDEFYIKHDLGTTSIERSEWNLAKSSFGSLQTGSSHIGQSSWGNGRTYESTPDRVIPVVVPTSNINYVYASKTNIIKSARFKDLEKRYKKELVAYPEIHSDVYGNPNINRVINSHLVDPVVTKYLNSQLCQYASKKGKTKEVNPLIYFTTATDRDFTYVIKGFYRDAHKNDAVLVVSVTSEGYVNWIDSFGFTKNAEFFVQNRTMDVDNVKRDYLDYVRLVSKFQDNIDSYWKRTPMEDYKYLSGDIDLPWQYELFVVILNMVGSFFLFRWMFKNEL